MNAFDFMDPFQEEIGCLGVIVGFKTASASLIFVIEVLNHVFDVALENDFTEFIINTYSVEA